jgi:hypothetical protein
MRYDEATETGFETSDFEQDENFEFEDAFGEGNFETEGGDFEEEGGDFEFETAPARAGVAAAAGGNVQAKIAQHRAAITHLRKAIPSMARYVRKEGKRYRLVMPVKTLSQAAAHLRVNPATVKGMVQALKRGNMQMGRGGLRREVDMEEETGSCAGTTDFSTHWWGTKLLLNECHTKALVESLGAGMSAAAACAVAIPVPQAKVACAIAAPLIGLSAGLIKAIDALGGNQGIVIRQTWVSIPPAPPVIIWHQ